MKEGKYAKTLVKILVTAIFLMQDMQRNFFSKFIEICMETPCSVPICMGTNMVATNQQKHLSLSFATKAWIYPLRNSETRTVQIAKFPNLSHFFNYHDSSLGRHVNAASYKSLEIQGYSYHKTKNPFEAKLCLNISSQLLLYIINVKSQEDQ